MNVVAVVVTYNRRELLKRNLSCLRANRPVQSIVVVNNGSTDGTTEWLKEQKDLIVIHQENVGGSGGFIGAFSMLSSWEPTGYGVWMMTFFRGLTVWSICCSMPTIRLSVFWLHAG